jgi:hypothetical protein
VTKRTLTAFSCVGLLLVLAGCGGGKSSDYSDPYAGGYNKYIEEFNARLAKSTKTAKRGDAAHDDGVGHFRAGRHDQAEAKFREAIGLYTQAQKQLGYRSPYNLIGEDPYDPERASQKVRNAYDKAHRALESRKRTVRNKLRALDLVRSGRAKIDPKTGKLVPVGGTRNPAPLKPLPPTGK